MYLQNMYIQHIDFGIRIRYIRISTGCKKALEDGNLYGITERMGNVLQDVTIPAYPEVERIKEQMKTLGAVNAMMSGSGPTVFGNF